MHNGSVADLEAMMVHYITGGSRPPFAIAADARRSISTPQEVADVIEFLKTLTGTKQVVSMPVLPN